MRVVALVLAGMALVLMLASGVALAITKVGTNGPDTLMGTKNSDKLLGKGSSDLIEGRGGKDVIRGGPGNDHPAFVGFLDGGGGADDIAGGTGADYLRAGPMADSSVDSLRGDEGDDFLITANRPAARDIVNCGAGRDRVSVDRKDTVRDNCERGQRPGPQPID